jgi:hypothetical protein
MGQRRRITLTEPESRAFVGPGASRYVHLWHNYTAGRAPIPRINLAAFFLGPLWFSYRKMYAATAAWFLVVLVVWVTKLTLFGPEEGQDSQRFYQVAGLVCAAVMGGSGNYLYLLKAHRAVTSARASVTDDRELEAVLRQVGGVTWLGVPVSMALGFVALVFAGVLASSLLGLQF